MTKIGRGRNGKGVDGRPKGDRKVYFTADVIRQVKTMTALGLNRVQVCECLGIAKRTLERAINEIPELKDAIYAGRHQANLKVAEAAFDMAKDKKHERMTMFWLRTRAGWKEGIDVNANISHEVIYETKLSRNKLKQSVRAEGETKAIEAAVDQLIDLEIGDE